MYIIINKTRQSNTPYEGSWPVEHLEQMLNKGDRVIVISLYSNTVKVPYYVEYNGIKEWEWENYPFFQHTEISKQDAG